MGDARRGKRVEDWKVKFPGFYDLVKEKCLEELILSVKTLSMLGEKSMMGPLAGNHCIEV